MQTTTVEGLQDPAPGQPFTAAGLRADNIIDGTRSAGLLDPIQSSLPGVSSSMRSEDDDTDVAALLAAADCDVTVSPLYCVYTIKEGDTLSSIAEKYGLSHGDFESWMFLVYSNNSVVVDEDDVAPGLKLRIPRGNGTIHTVGPAETLTDIADLYDVDIESILAVVENELSDANSVSVGKELFIPNPQRFGALFTADDSSPSSSDSGDDSSDGEGSSPSSGPSITGGGPSSSAGFIWPASGPLSSYYGPNHPLGIDIDLFNNGGAPVSAAMGGVVSFAGGNPCCSYGYYVVVNHGNGYQTLYAHLSSIGVSVGQVVAQGQYLGAGGSTGYSTGDHLHFEIHLNGSIVNPLNYLP